MDQDEMVDAPDAGESQDVHQDESQEDADLSQETPPEDVFIAPSIHRDSILGGQSYTHFSPIPDVVSKDMTVECVLGVDEAGRGPVLGPMVYALCYMPKHVEKPLLTESHHFDDSKVLTPSVRSTLMQTMCTPSTDLHQNCGWATRALSARDISSNMMQSSGAYNLNAQAMDATVALIQGVYDKGVKVAEIYIDTIGKPEVYQKKLERIFPQARITVAKKADSLYPCVSAASVCAKVTRDAALEVLYEAQGGAEASSANGWGSGYPSDVRCKTWLKRNMDPMFGWGNECRFSWGPVKDMFESKDAACRVQWPEEDGGIGDDSMKLWSFYSSAAKGTPVKERRPEIADWFGQAVTDEVF